MGSVRRSVGELGHVCCRKRQPESPDMRANETPAIRRAATTATGFLLLGPIKPCSSERQATLSRRRFYYGAPMSGCREFSVRFRYKFSCDCYLVMAPMLSQIPHSFCWASYMFIKGQLVLSFCASETSIIINTKSTFDFNRLVL